jgi:hypothetical protein
MEDLTRKQLGAYRIVAPLGEGGMAAVYKAYQPSMDRYVALKILPRHYAADQSFVKRFEQEARVIASLEHPNILPVYDFGEAEGYTFIVMRFSLAIDPNSPDVIYGGTGGGVGGGYGVYVSYNGGETWEPTNQGMLDYRISALAVDRVDSQILYGGADSGELFKNIDSGESWHNLTPNLPSSQFQVFSRIREIVVDPNAPEIVYLLSDSLGLAYTLDGGIEWKLLGNPPGQDQPMYTAATISFGLQPVLVACISGEGCWRYGP